MADVEAAGGVVCRLTNSAQVEVLVVHRPHRKDWTLPKGKLDPGETHKQAAKREVMEETGYTCRLARKLPDSNYKLPSGSSKRVKFWMMLVKSGEFERNSEVDEIQWLTPRKARKVLTYATDRKVLDDAVKAVGC